MSLKNLKPDDLKAHFIKGLPLVDVRAPVEFQQGSLPGAVSLPIMNDEERAAVGTTYKRQGQEAAVRLGHELVSGDVKAQRVEAWKNFFTAHPEAVFYCFRGGKRSQISQQWLREAGLERPLVIGGYKATRQMLMKELEEFAVRRSVLVVSGPTGSGKTHFLRALQNYPVLDLEGLAHHRGSAFGSLGIEQPSQIDYENRLAVSILQIEDKFSPQIKPLIEDESRLIGRIYQPASFFVRLRASPVIWLDEPLEVRAENVYQDYIAETAIGESMRTTPRCAAEAEILRSQALALFDRYARSLQSIHRKLGGLRTQEVQADLEKARRDFLENQELSHNKVWIEKLLLYYYDPLYLESLERRQVQVLFKGPRSEAAKFLASL